MESEHARRVREMFAGIANRYDLLNHLLSGNTDKRWRRLVAERLHDVLSTEGARALDLASVEDGLKELRRVLKPKGRAAILEFSTPVIPGFRKLFQFYFTRVLPRIGGMISGSRGAFEYPPDSVSRFPDQKRLVALMREAEFEEVEYKNLTGGIAALHLGTRLR